MPPQPPTFGQGRGWYPRASKARALDQRVWFSPDDNYEYYPDPRPERGTWHQIDWRHNRYRDIDPVTGSPIAGSEGKWRPLR